MSLITAPAANGGFAAVPEGPKKVRSRNDAAKLGLHPGFSLPEGTGPKQEPIKFVHMAQGIQPLDREHPAENGFQAPAHAGAVARVQQPVPGRLEDHSPAQSTTTSAAEEVRLHPTSKAVLPKS